MLKAKNLTINVQKMPTYIPNQKFSALFAVTITRGKYFLVFSDQMLTHPNDYQYDIKFLT